MMGAKVIPVQIIRGELAGLEAQRAVLELWKNRGAAEAHASVVAEIEALERILRRANDSADDLLAALDAMEWSGLTRSALDKRAHAAEGPKRWRRGDLPVADPFDNGVVEIGSETDQAGSVMVGEVNIDLKAGELAEEDLVERALLSSLNSV